MLCLGELHPPGAEARHCPQCWCQHAVTQTPLLEYRRPGTSCFLFLPGTKYSVSHFFSCSFKHNKIFIMLSFPVTLDTHLSECSTQRKEA